MNELLTSCPVCQAVMHDGSNECRRCGTSVEGLLANRTLATKAMEKQRLEAFLASPVFFRLG